MIHYHNGILEIVLYFFKSTKAMDKSGGHLKFQNYGRFENKNWPRQFLWSKALMSKI